MPRLSEPPFLEPADAEYCALGRTTGEGAVAIVVNPRDEVLLNLRDDIPGIAHPNRWSLLGGGCDPGESAAETVRRELLEEADVPAPRVLPGWRFVDREGSCNLLTAFVVPTTRTLGQLTLREGQDLGFFAAAEAFALDLVPFARRLLTAYFDRGPACAG